MKMNPGAERPSGFNFWQKIEIGFIGFTGWLLVWLIGTTIRFRIEGRENLDECREQQQPVILSFWHNQIFCQTFVFRFQQIVVMTSRHFDGEYIAKIIRKFGYGTARGSSTKGAVRALLELKKHLAQGRDVAITVDGPKGPKYRVKPGIVFLARKTGAPIITLHSEPEEYWELSSWDHFRIPKPFTKALVTIGDPFYVSPEEDDMVNLARYQNEIDRVRRDCEQRVQGKSDRF
jgi:lysophospholipid acyltransferase (LPLAT)-like uncharacterized protein